MQRVWVALLTASFVLSVAVAILMLSSGQERLGAKLGLTALIFLLTGAFPLRKVLTSTRAGGDARTAEPLDPSTSPVPWVSDAVWQRRRQWSRFTGLKSAAEPPGQLKDATATVVNAKWREARAPSSTRPATTPVMTLAEANTALSRTEDVGAFWNPMQWPVCCDTLGVLVLVNPTAEELADAERSLGRLDGACLGAPEGWTEELAAIREGGQPENGVNVFQCGACGRTYGVHSTT